MPPAKGTCSTPQIETKTKKEQHNEQHTAWRKLRVGLARCLWPHHAANHAGGGNESEVPLMTQGVGNATPGGSSGSRRRRRRPPRLPSLSLPSPYDRRAASESQGTVVVENIPQGPQAGGAHHHRVPSVPAAAPYCGEGLCAASSCET